MRWPRVQFHTPQLPRREPLRPVEDKKIVVVVDADVVHEGEGRRFAGN